MEDKIKLTREYHVHSVYSRNNHGKSTIEEIVQEARSKKLKTISITDHGPGHLMYGIKRKLIPVQREEIDRLKEKYDDIEILMGVEANVIGYNGEIDIREEEKKYFDFINLGFHDGVRFVDKKSFYNYHVLKRMSWMGQSVREKMIDLNTNTMVKALENNDIFIITHPGDKIDVDIEKIAQTCEKTNTVMEINNHHPHLSVEEIKISSHYNVKFSLGSDAHHRKNIANVNDSIKRVIESGLDISRIINID